MATHVLQAHMPQVELAAGMKVVLEAISPTTGLEITGVTSTAWAIYGLDLSDEIAGLEEVPRLTPQEVEEGELV